MCKYLTWIKGNFYLFPYIKQLLTKKIKLFYVNQCVIGNTNYIICNM